MIAWYIKSSYLLLEIKKKESSDLISQTPLDQTKTLTPFDAKHALVYIISIVKSKELKKFVQRKKTDSRKEKRPESRKKR